MALKTFGKRAVQAKRFIDVIEGELSDLDLSVEVFKDKYLYRRDVIIYNNNPGGFCTKSGVATGLLTVKEYAKFLKYCKKEGIEVYDRVLDVVM